MAPHATSISVTNRHEHASIEPTEILILDDLIRQRAADKDQVPLLAFPKSETGILDYEEFGGQTLDRFIDQAAKYYVNCGLGPVSR